VPISAALGRVTATAVRAGCALPLFDNSAMDGFAVRAADVRPGLPLPVSGRIFAGDVAVPALPPGRAVAIMTGAPLPAGADAPALAAELTALWRRHQSRQLEQFIRQLAAEYILELPELWQQIARGWAGLQREWRADECEQMRRLVHTMRGASASLNLAPLNAAARTLDQALALTTAVPPAAEQVAELDLAFEQLRRAIAALA